MIYEGDRIETVWFDLDDTLIDFVANSRTSLAIVYDTLPQLQALFAGSDRWIERYEYHNHRLWDLYSRAEIERDYLRMERFRLPLTEAGMADSEARLLSEYLDTYYLDTLAGQTAMVEGAVELLKAVRAQGDIKIGVLSNGFADVQYRKIANTGLTDLIDITVLSDDIDVNKPDRRLFDYAAAKAGSPTPGSNLMIGDNALTDIAGALGAGWHAIWLNLRSAKSAPGCAIARTAAEIGKILGL